MNANATTIDNGNDYTADEVMLGAKVVGWIGDVLVFVTAAAIAWCFSGFWLCCLIFLLSLVLMLIAKAYAVINYAVAHEEQVTAQMAQVGKAVNGLSARLSGLFRRS